jgi:hypothetical protein
MRDERQKRMVLVFILILIRAVIVIPLAVQQGVSNGVLLIAFFLEIGK